MHMTARTAQNGRTNGLVEGDINSVHEAARIAQRFTLWLPSSDSFGRKTDLAAHGHPDDEKHDAKQADGQSHRPEVGNAHGGAEEYANKSGDEEVLSTHPCFATASVASARALATRSTSEVGTAHKPIRTPPLSGTR